MSWLPVAVRKVLPGWRADTPEAFLLAGRPPATKYVVACLGDSITQGQISANYVSLLRARFGPAGTTFINAGVNGDLAFNVVNRLDAVIACRPDVVTLLVGTNDVNARFDDTWAERYRKDQGLPVSPTLAWYVENIEAIVRRLQSETQARIALVEVPMLGEDLDGRMNGLVRAYNEALHVAGKRLGVPCLPLYTRLESLFPAGHAPPPYAGDIKEILKAGMSSQLLRRSWDDIARRNGLVALTDHIHLSDRAASVVADLVAGFLESEPG